MFTDFRDKYLSYGRFAGKIVIKKLSAEEIEELEGFFGQNFHGQRSVTISAEKFAKALADSRFKEIQPLEILTGYFGMPLYAKVEIKEMYEQKIMEIEGEFKKIFEFTPAYYQLEKFKTLIRNKRNDLCSKIWMMCADPWILQSGNAGCGFVQKYIMNFRIVMIRKCIWLFLLPK